MKDLNELYNTTIEFEGRTYYYDPDFDCFYRRYDRGNMTHWETWGPAYAIVALGAMCWALS